MKKEFFFKDSLNGNVLENYIKWENKETGIGFMFDKKPISFNITIKIYRSYEYMFVFVIVPRNLNQISKSKKQIINAEKTFKEDNCVICLTTPSNILFCNCWHLCILKNAVKNGKVWKIVQFVKLKTQF